MKRTGFEIHSRTINDAMAGGETQLEYGDEAERGWLMKEERRSNCMLCDKKDQKKNSDNEGRSSLGGGEEERRERNSLPPEKSRLEAEKSPH